MKIPATPFLFSTLVLVGCNKAENKLGMKGESQVYTRNVGNSAHQYSEEYPYWITDEDFDAKLNKVQAQSIKYVCYQSNHGYQFNEPEPEHKLFRLCNLPSLTYIKLVNNNYKITTFLNLASLHITNDKIELLLKKLSKENKDKLETINLSYNQLTNVNGLSQLSNLEHLWLAHNQLTNVNGLGLLSNLTYLNLRNNQLTNVNGLGQLNNLNDLYLDHNQLTNVDELGQLSNLHYLYLNHNQLTNLDGLFAQLNNQECVVYHDIRQFRMCSVL